MKNKVLLMILDGWGKGNHTASDAISAANPKFVNHLLATCPNSELLTSGENVGLPDGQMGNSEVGHQNIGAGRIIYQDLVKINRACRDHSIGDVSALTDGFKRAVANGGAVHFIGLVSDGGVHSSMDHLVALCKLTHRFKLDSRTFIHAFMDGRDTDPRSGKGYLAELQKQIADTECKLASVVGRYYAMDRDKRWERVAEAYHLLVDGIGVKVASATDAVQAMYDQGITDEFIKPISICPEGDTNCSLATIKAGDMVVFFNFRNDRAKELTIALTQYDIPEHKMVVVPDLYFCTMTPYDAGFKGLHILFDKDNISNTLGEYISSKGLTQLRIAETEKFAHVTFFFNGGRQEAFLGEKRILINSPKVATYDLQPEMSIHEITDALIADIKGGTPAFSAAQNTSYKTSADTSPDFICLNFANGDMVGHTGVYDAIIKAVQAVDNCVQQVVDCARAAGYTILITADHGNADHARNADGSANTAHSLNPVPFILVSDNPKLANIHLKNGVLADIAPTVLDIMELPVPAEMTGTTLLSRV